MEAGYVLGLDLGGTQIKAAVVDAQGHILRQIQTETAPSRGADEVGGQLIDICRLLLAEWPDARGIGVGAPGLVDAERQTVRTAPNFPEWRNVPLRQMLETPLQRRIELDNDVNCFGLAEHRWGAGREFKQLLALAIGTGIGGAVILDGKLYRGSSGAAAELGHISVDLWGPKCACGNLGCVERYLGERWLTESARAALDDEGISSPAEVGRRAAAGDAAAVRFLEDCGEILGVACTTLIHIFDPEAIIIGGGTAQAGEPLFRGIKKAVGERAYPILSANVKILPAQLGAMAGALGAAALVLD